MTQEEKGPAIVPDDQPRELTRTAGTLALAMMSDAEFEQRLAALKKGQERQSRVQRELMIQDVDYGIIPGTGAKPTLLQPGAEKLCNLYGYIPAFDIERIIGDGETTPNLEFISTCYLHIGGKDGPIVGSGAGEANSWERKYRYRVAERACPRCGALRTIGKSKEEYGGGWYCASKKGGCGVKFERDDPAITAQQGGQVDNPDPFDLANTLIKMASKRAYVGATLRTTATSGLFTQDMEDQVEASPAPAAPPQTAPVAPAIPRPAVPTASRQGTPPPRPETHQQPAEEVPEGADDFTAFFKAAFGLGYPAASDVFKALGVKNLQEWKDKNPGKSLAGCLDELSILKGKK